MLDYSTVAIVTVVWHIAFTALAVVHHDNVRICSCKTKQHTYVNTNKTHRSLCRSYFV